MISNQPAAFTLYSSHERADPVNALVVLDQTSELQRHAPLVTAFRYGKRSRRVPLAVQLSAAFTETGTLEIWCQSRETGHRWRLAFNLRGVEADPLEGLASDDGGEAEHAVVVEPSGDRGAGQLLADRVRGRPEPAAIAPETVIGELETLIGHGKLAWPLPVIRALADTLLEAVAGRQQEPGARSPLAEPHGLLRPSGLRQRTRRMARLGAAQGVRGGPRLSEGDPEPGRVAGAVAARGRGVQRRPAAGAGAARVGPAGTRPAQAGPAQPSARTGRRGGSWPRSNGSMPGSAPGMATSSSIGSARSRAARTGSGR